jgi:hypothetical protein
MARNTCHDARFAPHVGADVNARQCTGVEKDLSKMPREPVEKHLSWSSDIPPAARFPPLDLQETHFASGSGLLLRRFVAGGRSDGRMNMLLGGDDWLGAPLAVPEVINHLTMRSCEA